MQPDFNTLPDFYLGYVKSVKEKDVILALKHTKLDLMERFKSIPEQNGDFRYDRGKWSIKEVINHVIDAERVFAYRALSFARNDKTELPGFDENAWAPEAWADRRSLDQLIKEFKHTRKSTIDLFESFTEEMLMAKGKANGVEFSVVNLGYIIAGHGLHHSNIISERYMSS